VWDYEDAGCAEVAYRSTLRGGRWVGHVPEEAGMVGMVLDVGITQAQGLS
jgi:hypothetical protein